MREEIIEVIEKNIKVDREKVRVKMDRGDKVQKMEVDIEIKMKEKKGREE